MSNPNYVTQVRFNLQGALTVLRFEFKMVLSFSK